MYNYGQFTGQFTIAGMTANLLHNEKGKRAFKKNYCIYLF